MTGWPGVAFWDGRGAALSHDSTQRVATGRADDCESEENCVSILGMVLA